jgi:hypothetical protein
MTTDKLRQIAKTCLKEASEANPPAINVIGEREKFDNRNRDPKEISRKYERTLDSFDEKELRHEISLVLLELASKGGLVMCDPRNAEGSGENRGMSVINVEHGNLYLSFSWGAGITEYKPLFCITCWYYPVRT